MQPSEVTQQKRNAEFEAFRSGDAADTNDVLARLAVVLFCGSAHVGFVLDALEQALHDRGQWRSLEAMKYATLEWLDRFNNRRLLEPIGNIRSAEAEANFYATLETQAMAAEITSISLRLTRRGSPAINAIVPFGGSS